VRESHTIAKSRHDVSFILFVKFLIRPFFMMTLHHEITDRVMVQEAYQGPSHEQPKPARQSFVPRFGSHGINHEQ
jgi:hypothetical protein